MKKIKKIKNFETFSEKNISTLKGGECCGTNSENNFVSSGWPYSWGTRDWGDEGCCSIEKDYGLSKQLNN